MKLDILLYRSQWNRNAYQYAGHANLEKYRWAENNLEEGNESILSQAWSITESLQYTTSNSSPLKFLTLLA